MDASIKNAIERCEELLNTVNEDTEFKSKISKQFQLKKIHLLTTAEVITNVLHKNNNVSTKSIRKRKFDELNNESKLDYFDFDSQINEESKTTRRNAHYKSTVLVIFYYIIYYSYYNKTPKNIGYNHIIQTNPSAKQYLDSQPWLLHTLYSPKKLRKYQEIKLKHKLDKINTIAVDVGDNKIEYKPIQHYNNFKQYTYDYKLANVIDGSMLTLIKFGYQNFNKNCREFIAINLVIKHKEKVKYDLEKRNKKKPIRYIDETIIDENDYEGLLVNTEALQKDNLEKNKSVKEYMNLTIEELKIKLKEPSVLLKFYQAFLFECDWELLFQYLANLLTEGFCYATMMKLLIYLIWNVTKIVCIANEREGQNRNLDILLKQYKYREVINQLQIWTHNYKYSIYDLPQQDISTNTKAFDLRCFKDLARDTRNMYFHFTSNPIKLEINEMEFESINTNIKYIEYTLDGCNKVVFDLIRITKTNTNTKIDLSKSSWKERLDKLQEIYNLTNRKETIAKLTLTNKRIIQFDKLPCGKSVCHYIRTSGLGVGTLFFSANNKKIRCTNMPNKRFRKITIEDLEYKKLEINIERPIEKSPPYQQEEIQQNTQQYQQIITPIVLLNQLISQFNNGRGLINSITSPTHATSHCNSLDIAPTTSPIPSPPHDINIDYLGELRKLNNDQDLQFIPFKEDDDF